jgi:peptide/nickel transport system permease protein
MISRFFRSRGAGKLKRNRWAMVSLGIIAVYFGLSGWMMAVDAVTWVGASTGLWDLSRTPYVSAFNRSRMLEEVGPPSLGGLGRPIGTTGRLDYVEFFFRKADQTIEGIEKLDPASGRSSADVIDDTAVLERRLLTTDPAELRVTLAEGRAILDRLDAARSQVNAAQTVAIFVTTARSRLADLRSPPEEADLAILREEAAFGLDDIIAAIEGYERSTGVEDSAFDPAAVEAMRAASEAFLDPEGDTPDVAGALAAIDDAARNEVERQTVGVREALPEAESFVDELMPKPDGFAGVVYKTRLLLGTDRQGRSILMRSLYSGKVAVQVGVIVGLTAVVVGSLLGAAAAFFGGWVDHAVNWLYSTFSSIPQLVLLAVLSFAFLSEELAPYRGLPSLFIAFAITYWIGPCRVIRGETLKIRELEYVQAATAIGFGRFYILVRHILPNTLHLMFINFSLLFVGAIKGEVILTFLGLGLPLGEGASWGIMISQSKAEVVQGFFWQIGAASFFMFVLVLAFNILSDALQDAFDPKHVG